jgi:hypothetical protein
MNGESAHNIPLCAEALTHLFTVILLSDVCGQEVTVASKSRHLFRKTLLVQQMSLNMGYYPHSFSHVRLILI